MKNHETEWRHITRKQGFIQFYEFSGILEDAPLNTNSSKFFIASDGFETFEARKSFEETGEYKFKFCKLPETGCEIDIRYKVFIKPNDK